MKVDRMLRLGWTQGKISETIGLSQNRVSEIIGNTNFGNIDNLFSQGRSMEYIARHYKLCGGKNAHHLIHFFLDNHGDIKWLLKDVFFDIVRFVY